MPLRRPGPAFPVVARVAPRAGHALGRAVAAVLLAVAALLPAAPVPVRAAEPVTMEARALLEGHARLGSWFAIAVDLANDGPAVTGELRIAGGANARTQYGVEVELATGSRKQFVLYAQPPAFGTLAVSLVSGSTTVAKRTVAIALHDASQLVVGVLAEQPGRIAAELDLLPSAAGLLPVVVSLEPQDLPERVEGWAALDRLVWQDTDAAALSTLQLEALRRWIAGGGRLVIAGGLAGPDALAALPDAILPYRPTAVLDADPEVLRGLLGSLPGDAAALPALAGSAGAGRVLATSGDRVIAADLAYGSGGVTLLGFDPTVPWLAAGDTWDAPLWRRFLPARSGGTAAFSDDSQLISALQNLPMLALPPVGGLLALLVGYIVLVGPLNYLVLRRADRREWAWLTVPALILVFATGAFAFGGSLRGSDVIVHEVAIVRGAAGTSEATVQSYLGVFSPSRTTYEVRVPGGALLAAPINTEMFGPDTSGLLDVLQGDPARIRNMAVGVASMRAVRAEAAVTGPVVTADLRLEADRLRGTLRNASDRTLEAPAIVLGQAVVTLDDLAPGATATIDLALSRNAGFGVQLSERVIGQVFWPGDGSPADALAQRKIVRRSVIDQLTYDPMSGFASTLALDGPVLLAWGTDPVIPLDLGSGVTPRRLANVLYQVPLPITIGGRVTFRNDLVRTVVLENDSAFFSKDPWTLSLGPGTVRVAFRPIPFGGTLEPTTFRLAVSFGGEAISLDGSPPPLAETTRCTPGTDGCLVPMDGLPDLELLDRTTGTWVQYAHPVAGAAYAIADPARFVDPATGEVQARFVNERQDGIGFQVSVLIGGTVR